MKYEKRMPGLTIDNIADHCTPDPATGCWNWTRAVFKCGYGAKTIRRKTYYAHRLSLALYQGPITDGLYVLHSCDNRKCINPAHLRTGTQKENLQEARSKGRLLNYTNQAAGETHGQAKLTNSIVCHCRRLWLLGSSIASLARTFNVNKKTMASALKRTTWKCA